MAVSRLVRHWFPDRRPSLDDDRVEHTLAVLVGARSVIERGWLQGAWYLVEASDGRRRVIGQ